LRGAGHNLDTTRSQNFTYDQLNRISSALTTSTHATSPTHCWGETYTLDAWANLNSITATTNSNYTGCSQESGFSQIADGNNHLPSFSYDASGNTQNDGVNSYTWDAESQLKTAAGLTYTYDGDGRRVSKVGSKLYWYGSGGDILAETNTSGTTTAEYIFFGGKRIAMLPAGSSAQFYVDDLLGTSRVITTNTGVVCYDADFYPYGGERTPYTNTCTQNNYKFEGKERDTETGNDDFGARYYSNRFGRWLSADWSSVPVAVPYANLSNPQTLNLYAMVSDDPESFADLDGHDPTNNCATTGSNCGQGTIQQQRVAEDAANGTPPANQGMSTLDKTQLALDAAGFIPGPVGWVANGASAVISAAEGHLGDAALSALAAVPLVGIVGEAGKAAKLAKEATALERAAELANSMGKTKDFVTIAVTETKQGVRVISSSENALRPAARSMLKEGEVAVKGAGHAETTGLKGAKQLGLTPTGVAASRKMCWNCVVDVVKTLFRP